MSSSSNRSTSVSRGLQVETEDLIQFSMSCSNNAPGGRSSATPGGSPAGGGESNNNFKRDVEKARPEIRGEATGTGRKRRDPDP